MKKLIGIIALLGIVLSLTYTGCRKGEDDPFLSLRSRDKRIIGTWLLKSSSEVKTTNTTTTDYNNKNSRRTTVAKSETQSETFDGTVSTSDFSSTTTTTDKIYTVVESTSTPGTYTYNVTTEVVVDVSNISTKYSYSVELEINEDHTYKATFSETKNSKHTSGKQNIGGIDYPDTPYDTTYSPANTHNWIEEGDWYWEDANNKKIMIVAGNVMNGKLKRLSNKEVVLEDITEESDDNTLNTTVVDYPESASAILTYSDNKDPYRDTTGVKTNNIVETTSRTYTSTWEAKK